MKFGYILRLSGKSFMQRKLRSWLTILGIVIGVGAVVAILSLGNSMQESVESHLGGMGADIITVTPGFSRASMRGFPGGGDSGTNSPKEQKNLTGRDIQIIESIPEVEYVNGITSGRGELTYLSESITLTIEGVDPLAWREMTTSELESGRYLTQNDGNVIVVGSGVSGDMFKEPLSLNTQISIEGISFKIVGILGESGGFGGSDRSVYVPYDSAVEILEDSDRDVYTSIEMKITSEDIVENTMEEIEEKLMLSRHVTEETKDFTVSSSLQMVETVSEVSSTISLFLAGIAGVSLLVGAIGIANTMFMSVMERTKQIGILKALGTTNFEVMKLFITESAIIGFVGGLMGVFLAFILIGIMSEMGFSIAMGGMGRGGFNMLSAVSPELIAFALGFSTLIGIVSGLIPARMASKLQPTEALRYE